MWKVHVPLIQSILESDTLCTMLLPVKKSSLFWFLFRSPVFDVSLCRWLSSGIYIHISLTVLQVEWRVNMRSLDVFFLVFTFTYKYKCEYFFVIKCQSRIMSCLSWEKYIYFWVTYFRALWIMCCDSWVVCVFCNCFNWLTAGEKNTTAVFFII